MVLVVGERLIMQLIVEEDDHSLFFIELSLQCLDGFLGRFELLFELE